MLKGEEMKGKVDENGKSNSPLKQPRRRGKVVRASQINTRVDKLKSRIEVRMEWVAVHDLALASFHRHFRSASIDLTTVWRSLLDTGGQIRRGSMGGPAHRAQSP